MEFILSEYKTAIIVLICTSVIIGLIVLSLNLINDFGLRLLSSIVYHGGK